MTDASNEGWDADVGDTVVSGLWMASEHVLHINLLEMMAVYGEVQHFLLQLLERLMFIYTNNTIVAAYIHLRGGMKSRSVAASALHLKICARPTTSTTQSSYATPSRMIMKRQSPG